MHCHQCWFSFTSTARNYSRKTSKLFERLFQIGLRASRTTSSSYRLKIIALEISAISSKIKYQIDRSKIHRPVSVRVFSTSSSFLIRLQLCRLRKRLFHRRKSRQRSFALLRVELRKPIDFDVAWVHKSGQRHPKRRQRCSRIKAITGKQMRIN